VNQQARRTLSAFMETLSSTEKRDLHKEAARVRQAHASRHANARRSLDRPSHQDDDEENGPRVAKIRVVGQMSVEDALWQIVQTRLATILPSSEPPNPEAKILSGLESTDSRLAATEGQDPGAQIPSDQQEDKDAGLSPQMAAPNACVTGCKNAEVTGESEPTDRVSEVRPGPHGWRRQTDVWRHARGPTDTMSAPQQQMRPPGPCGALPPSWGSEVRACRHGWRRETTVSRRASTPIGCPARVLAIGPDLALCEVDEVGYLCRCHPSLLESAGERPTVGDLVLLETVPNRQNVSEQDSPRILQVLPRRSVLARSDSKRRGGRQLFAANVDLALMVVSPTNPPFHPALIDRFLIALGEGGVAPLLCVNKIDLLAGSVDRAGLEEKLACYRALGIPVFFTSTTTGVGIDELRSMLVRRTVVLLGHSGVGKTSLLNALDPRGEHRTGAVRESDGKGRHTTTGATLRHLPDGIDLIDTAGIREFGLGQIPVEAIVRHFREFAPFRSACRYPDCRHLHEPDCAVKTAVRAGQIPRQRYASYRKLIGGEGGGDGADPEPANHCLPSRLF
jgi:ribosome small subunit-dependent GTPase A